MEIRPQQRDCQNRRRNQQQPVHLPFAQLFAGIHALLVANRNVVKEVEAQLKVLALELLR